MNDQKRPLAIRAVHAMKVSRQGRCLVRDLDGLYGRITENGASLVALDRLLVGAIDSGIVWLSVQKELRSTVVRGRPQEAVARADPVPARELLVRFVLHSFGGGIPFVVPAVEVARGDARDRGKHFAKLAGTVAGGAERSLGFIPELKVVREKRRLCRRGVGAGRCLISLVRRGGRGRRHGGALSPTKNFLSRRRPEQSSRRGL